MAHPDWVLKHKRKGTQINCVNGHYYLYEVSSVWNKKKGRAQKITKAYLGSITEDGLIPPKTAKGYFLRKSVFFMLLQRIKENQLITGYFRETFGTFLPLV